ncbi:unnamed protein product [Closterium sp. Naga37s-1]|nr:unnamed protein product [Closterium sp. Naga37s-1]
MTEMRNSHAAHSSPPNGPMGRDGAAPLTPRQERAAAACRAELRNVLHEWAAEARRREAEAADYQAAVPLVLPSPHARLTREPHRPANPADSPDSRPTTDDSTTTGANGACDPVPGGGPAGAASGGGGAAATAAGPAGSAALLPREPASFPTLSTLASSSVFLLPFPSPFIFSIPLALHSILPGAPGRRSTAESSIISPSIEVHQGARTSTTEKSNPSPTCPICHCLHSTHPPPPDHQEEQVPRHEGAQVPRIRLLQATRSSSFLFRRLKSHCLHPIQPPPQATRARRFLVFAYSRPPGAALFCLGASKVTACIPSNLPPRPRGHAGSSYSPAPGHQEQLFFV